MSQWQLFGYIYLLLKKELRIKIQENVQFFFFLFFFNFFFFTKIANKVVIQISTGLHYLKAHLSHFPRFPPVCHSESQETNQVPRLPTV